MRIFGASLVAIAVVACVNVTCADSIYVSGFNVGEVYGAGANPNGTVTADVDGSNSHWTGAGYTDGTNTVTQGLPTGPFMSATGSGQTYQFQPFNMGDDALRGAGTITVTPGDYSALYLLGTGGGGAGVADVTLNFSDSTSDTFTGGLANNDWGNAGNVAVAAQRTTPGAVTGAITSGTWNVFESKITLSPADELKTLTSITITPNGGGGVSNLYAVNGVSVVPEPGSVVLLGLGAIGLLAIVRRRR